MLIYAVKLNWARLNLLVKEAATADQAATFDSFSGWGGTGDCARCEESLHGLMSINHTCSNRLVIAWKIIHSFKMLNSKKDLKEQISSLQSALRFVLAIGELKTYLLKIAPAKYTTSQQTICCQSEAKGLNVQGLAWFFGAVSDFGYPPIQAIRRFVKDGNLDKLRIAVLKHNNILAGKLND